MLAASAPGMPDRAAPPGQLQATSPQAGPLRSPLAEALDAALLPLMRSGARVSAAVRSLDSGATLYALDPDALLNPASNVKLVTAAAALARLGPEHRFDTELSVDAASAALPGGLARTLYVRGKGDPSVTTERLHALAAELFHLGLRRVGDLALDDGWFDQVRVGPGFDQEAGDKTYLAPAGALSLNVNTVAVHVGPGPAAGAPARVEVEPESACFELVARVTTAGPRAVRHLTLVSTPLPGGRQRLEVEGRIPLGGRPAVLARKAGDPARYLGETLRRALEQRGIRVVGRVVMGAVPADARLLTVVESEPLGELVRRLQKGSNNFVAEQLVKALGAAGAGPPGSWPKGIAAVEGVLAELGLPRGSYLMRNGSGMNDANRFSARQLTAVLEAAWRRFPWGPEYVAALPVAGRDGTLRSRLEGTEAAGEVRAKTGTLDGVVTLSGYAETPSRERLVFAFLVNDHGGQGAAATRAVDQAALALARGGARPAVAPAVRVPAAAAPGARAAVDATARTYLALGRTGDRRNAPFLRAALRTEADPAVRLAVAEALYRSDPAGAEGQPLLEEAARADGAAVAAVVAAGDPGEPAPVLAGLSDLAADGGREALERLLALAPDAAATGLREPLSATLADLADAIPEPLLAAIAAAPPAVRQAAAELIGDRLPGLPPPASEPASIGPGPAR